MFRYAFAALLLAAVPVVTHAAQKAETEYTVTVHQRLNDSCELIQKGTLLRYKQYAAIVLDGSVNEVYSPELGKGDLVYFTKSETKDALKHARKSGFEVRAIENEDMPLPRVIGGDGCPAVEHAITQAEQQRSERRKHLQSRLHKVGNDILPPRPIQQKQPQATQDDAQQMRPGEEPRVKQGTVVLITVIGLDGVIQETKVLRTLDPVLDRKAIEVVRQWRFSPAHKNGLPVPVEMNLEVNFRLH